MKKLFVITLALLTSTLAFSVEKKAASHSTSAPAVRHVRLSSSNYEYEIQTAFTGGSYTSTRVGTATVTTLSASASWAKFIMPKIQAGGEGTFTNVSGGASGSSSFDIMGFGTYNLDDDTNNSFYAKGGLGLFAVPTTTGGTETKFGFMFGGGKRFPIWERVSFSPEVRLIKKGDLDMALNIYFLNLAIAY